jgi:glycosyltransferase involved in cell wall biosynthesis
MRLLILDEGYPHPDNLMGDVFVHVRVKEYAKHHEVKAFAYFYEPREIEYEGIQVRFFDDTDKIVQAVKEYNPDKILIHFYQSWMLEKVLKQFQVPVMIWVHGYEALGWYRRLFNFSWYSPVLLNYVKKNTVQQYHFHKLIRYANQNDRIQFVFVSDWMRRITETDSLAKIKRKSIIANPIDTDLFHYRDKDTELRKKILLLRSFTTRKYANDISVEAILKLSKKPFFEELEFTLIGKGPFFDKLTPPLKQFPNVSLQQTAIRQRHIPELHAAHGVFLCPTRQDAQGVSMCEAMSSGLIPVTSDNTAIPEFVSDNQTGFLTRNSDDVAAAIEKLYHQPELFRKMSEATASSVRKLCSLEEIVSKELKLIER